MRFAGCYKRWASAGWGAFPNGTALEVKGGGAESGAETPQGDLLDRATSSVDLLVLGPNADDGHGRDGSRGWEPCAGRVHAEVALECDRGGSEIRSGVIEQQLVPAILRLNYGDTDEAPTLTFEERTEDDLTARAQWIATLAGAGAGGIIPLDWLGKTFRHP